MTQVGVEPIRKQITVAAPQATAFEVFTTRMGTWWNRDYRIGTEPIADVIVETEPGGRWFEVGEGGAECDWGRVLVWEPPARVVLVWQISADWAHDPELHTELDVRFEGTGPERTLVTLEHRRLDALGEQGQVVRSIFDSPGGWSGLLERYHDALTS